MNLQVNLIFDTETRSANILNAKSLTRMGIIVVPALLLTLAGIASIQTMVVKSGITSKENQWAAMEPNRKRLEQLNTDITQMKLMVNHLEHFNTASLDWNAVMNSVRDNVKENVQLSEMKIYPIEITTGNKKSPGFRLELTGDAFGPQANPNTLDLRAKLTSSGELKDIIQSANIENFQLVQGTVDHYTFKINVAMAAPKKAE